MDSGAGKGVNRDYDEAVVSSGRDGSMADRAAALSGGETFTVYEVSYGNN